MLIVTLLTVTAGAANADEVSASLANGQLTTQAKVVASDTPSGSAVQFNSPTPDAAGFVHPGILVDQSQLDYAKSQLVSGAQPQTSTYAAMSTTLAADGQAFGSLTYTPHPAASLSCTGSVRTACQFMDDDAVAAYTQALMFYFGVDSSSGQHGANAIAIVNAWADTLHSVSGTQVVLETSWAGSMFARAAELMRYSYTPAAGQPVLDIPAITSMFDEFVALYNGPDGALGYASSNGNWELAGAEAKMSIGVFEDNRATFNDGVAVWRARVPAYIYESTDNPTTGLPIAPPHGLYDDPAKLTCFWLGSGTPTTSCNPPTAAAGFTFVNGMVQETCRDVSHVQLGLEALTNGAETARIQGVDLFGEQEKRIVDGYEFVAKYDNAFVNTGVWPTQPCAGRPGSHVGVSGNGTGGVGFRLGWEIAYNEFSNRLGVPMPQTAAFIAQSERPSPNKASQHMAWEALTHAGSVPAGCTQPDLRSGQATTVLSVPSDGTYRLWSRLKPAADGAASYLLSIDGACPVSIGSSLSAGAWNWVGQKPDGSDADFALTAGAHTLVLTGVTAGLSVDTVMLTDDPTCQPVGADATCGSTQVPPDSPAVTLTAPASGATAVGSVDLEAGAVDQTPIDHVEFSLDGSKIGSSSTAPYSFTWDSTSVANGTHQLKAVAVDTAGATGSSAITVIDVENPLTQPADTQPPTAPANVKLTATSPTTVQATWDPSTDDTGVTGYTVSRNGTAIGTVTSPSFTDITAQPATSYSYSVTASDAAGNVSAASGAVSVTTPVPPDTTAPTAPTALMATAVSPTQVNLVWNAATDNVGGYRLHGQS